LPEAPGRRRVDTGESAYHTQLMAYRLTARRVAPLLFCSGFCGLVYQVGWLREFRLVFGASTAASAAVLAIFIGGLGLGGLLLGKRADAANRPLMLYGNLELVIAVTAALSPFLLAGIRALYVAAGGTVTLGLAGGTGLRLVLATVVLAVPTVAMGGTLAAATRSIAVTTDERRRELAVLYGVNTLGAVAGALLSTFLLLEIFGTRRTIWLAALVNVLIAILARGMGRKADEATPVLAAEREVALDGPKAAPLRFVLLASGVVGFAFFLMEMTWYRMLGPILGGTLFTFGLILAVALLGIGLGGLAYALRPAAKRATVRGLMLTCLLEAIALAIPLALGDRIAVAAASLRTTAAFGFGGQVVGWAAICVLVILPAAIATGVQFPLLVNLVGRGRADVGRHLGWVYGTNTIGAIAGSLLGGFVLLPWLGAIGCWRLAIGLLLALAIGAFALVVRGSSRWVMGAVGAAVGVAILLLVAKGPTAAWRHGGIGAGRTASFADPIEVAAFISQTNRVLQWETEGVESSVALIAANGLAFVVNGKIDGNAQDDAATQIMGGLVGAAIHPSPKRAIVIGLGTGETAGWLADAPGVEKVDVVELEPAILEVARRCAPTNRNVLDNPKIDVRLGDAREVLQVSDDKYDLVFSEPSNPYRAGVSSLYTREFYEAVRDRLGEDGLFLQWTQSYEVDGATIATIYSTLLGVFPEVHTWRLKKADLLFVASMHPIHYDAARIAERVHSPVFQEALSYAWWVDGVEGLLSHFVGGTTVAHALADRVQGAVNTDDHTLIEFAFARSLGLRNLQNVFPIRQLALELRADRPEVTGAIDWGRFEELRTFDDSIARYPLAPTGAIAGERLARARARDAYVGGNLTGAAAAWKQQPAPPTAHWDRVMVAESFASSGEEADVTGLRPAEVSLIRARLFAHQKKWDEAAAAVVAAFTAVRSDPFVLMDLVDRGLGTAKFVAGKAPAHAAAIVEALSRPFAMYTAEEDRIATLLAVASIVGDAAFAAAIEPIEPHVPWTRELLVRRLEAYRATGNPRGDRAEADLEAFIAGGPLPLMGSTGEGNEPATE
jgi:spermidine synthase